MIHQHFKLIDVFTAAENIVLGLEGEKGKLNKEAIHKVIRDISDRYGFEIDPDQKVYNMSVSQKQTVEIVKVLYRGADILILDEPTAVLTPQETEKLFAVMRNMKADGKAIIIITHKLHEVLSVSDRVAVLRKGKYVGSVDTRDIAQPEIQQPELIEEGAAHLEGEIAEHAIVQLGIVALQQLCPGQAVMEGVPVELDLRQLLLGELLPLLAGAVVRP